MHLKAARELGVGADLTSGATLVTVPYVVPPILLPLSQLSPLKGKPTATVSKPPQTQIESEPPTKVPKVTGKAIPPAKPPQWAPGSSGLEEGEIPADTQKPVEEGAVGGPVPDTGGADSTDKPGMFLPVYCNQFNYNW